MLLSIQSDNSLYNIIEYRRQTNMNLLKLPLRVICITESKDTNQSYIDALLYVRYY